VSGLGTPRLLWRASPFWLKLLEITAAVLALAALGNWIIGGASFASWFEAVSTFAAVMAAMYAGLYAANAWKLETAREQRWAEDKRQSQAGLVAAWPGPAAYVYDSDDPGGQLDPVAVTGLEISVRNASQLPVTESGRWRGSTTQRSSAASRCSRPGCNSCPRTSSQRDGHRRSNRGSPSAVSRATRPPSSPKVYGSKSPSAMPTAHAGSANPQASSSRSTGILAADLGSRAAYALGPSMPRSPGAAGPAGGCSRLINSRSIQLRTGVALPRRAGTFYRVGVDHRRR
jgi:hypothetical protein